MVMLLISLHVEVWTYPRAYRPLIISWLSYQARLQPDMSILNSSFNINSNQLLVFAYIGVNLQCMAATYLEINSLVSNYNHDPCHLPNTWKMIFSPRQERRVVTNCPLIGHNHVCFNRINSSGNQIIFILKSNLCQTWKRHMLIWGA